MIPDFVASDHSTSYQFSQGFSGGPPIQGYRQQPPPQAEGIDPRLLDGSSGYLSAYDGSQGHLYHEGGHPQCPSPALSGCPSVEVLVTYLDDEVSGSVSNPISHIAGNTSTTYSTLVDTCICGCGRGSCIPQREYDRQRTDSTTEQELRELITFSVNGVCGYPLAEALRKRYTGLDGRDDKVFNGFKSSISIRLEWLPYEKWTRQIRTLTWRKNPDHISRAKLATEVAKRMNIFFEEMKDKFADPSYQQYMVRPGVIDIDHLELVALKRVAKASYMPHFRLITASPPQ